MKAYFHSHGTGDLGPTLTLPNGEEVRRLEDLHGRDYVSIFGKFRLERTAYGTGAKPQALAFVPLDNRLPLPDSDFSYLLQDWDQELAVEQAFLKVNQTIECMLRLRQHSDSLEGMNRQMARDTAAFRDAPPPPPAAEEGQILVTTADCKGVVMRPSQPNGLRRRASRRRVREWQTYGRRRSGVHDRPLCASHPRGGRGGPVPDANYTPPPRPEPCHKHVWAILPQGPRSPTAASTCSTIGCCSKPCCAICALGNRRFISATVKKRLECGPSIYQTRTRWTFWTSCT